jgi:hypothetical protein
MPFFVPFLLPFCFLFATLFARSSILLFPFSFVTHFFLHPLNPSVLQHGQERTGAELRNDGFSAVAKALSEE